MWNLSDVHLAAGPFRDSTAKSEILGGIPFRNSDLHPSRRTSVPRLPPLNFVNHRQYQWFLSVA
jgi:hypothetical protein